MSMPTETDEMKEEEMGKSLQFSPLENEEDVSELDLKLCLKTLQKLVDNNRRGLELLEDDERIAFLKAAGILSRPSRSDKIQRKKEARKINKDERRALDRRARGKTGIRAARIADVFMAPKQKQLLAETVQEDDEEEEQELPNDREDKEKPELSSYRNCYVCKAEYTQLHHFYDCMCQRCGDLNYKKRFQRADLTGQVALITGSRLKIGYHATLMMLRAGATVIATTRFPADSAIRFAKEDDFGQWNERLHIHGLDLRHTPSVELFCSYIIEAFDRLDILINNAAQTVRRPPGFYAHMLEGESMAVEEHSAEVQNLLASHTKCLNILNTNGPNRIRGAGAVAVNSNSNGNGNGTIARDAVITSIPSTGAWDAKSPGIALSASAQLSQIPYSYDGYGNNDGKNMALRNRQAFPEGKLDVDLQQVDLRTTNSWRLKLGDVSTLELLEVQLVNAVAPFVLCNRLAPMMKRDHTGKKHIVNVTAMEGKFYRFSKNPRHPHTNMAKAALNMLTHTSSGELAKDGIYMNAVDTGWVTDEDPAQLASHKVEKHDFQPPLDIVDGAARVCDPFFDGINRGEHWCGKFLKDFFPIDW